MPIRGELFQLILARLFTIRPKTSDDLLTSDKVFIFLIFLCTLFARAVEYITKMLVTMPVTDMPAFVTYKRTINFIFNHIASISAKVLQFPYLFHIYKKNFELIMKRTIRLSENDLHNIIKESVSRILKEDVYDGQEMDFAYGGGDGSDFTPEEIKELAFMLLKNPVEEQWKPQYYGFCQVQRVPSNQAPANRGSILSRNPFITCSKEGNGIIFIQIGRKPNTHWLDEGGYTYMAWK